jgi:tellurite resistance protein TehA-like permease
MATGIVSVAAADHGVDAVSGVLAVIAVVALPVLVYRSAVAWKRDAWSISGDLDIAMGLFTYVAACCVLAARFSGVQFVVLVFGGLAVQGWLSLTPLVVKNMWKLRWTGLRDRAHGGWELASVATSGLAIVAVAAGIVVWAFAFWVLALMIYVVMTGLVCWRAVHEPAVRRDVPPDHWILMGGLAIATLAGSHLYGALQPGPIADVVRGVTIVTWVLASLAIVPLACVGWRRIRAWPAVFPLGMYASATHDMAGETGWGWLTGVSLAFLWIAFALWLAVALPHLHVISARFRSPTDG